MREFEKMQRIDAFCFTRMMVTAQGLAFLPLTFAGKLFASLFSFIAVGMGLTASSAIFELFVADFWKSLRSSNISQFNDEIRRKPFNG